jgi:hypothetical protein
MISFAFIWNFLGWTKFEKLFKHTNKCRSDPFFNKIHFQLWNRGLSRILCILYNIYFYFYLNNKFIRFSNGAWMLLLMISFILRWGAQRVLRNPKCTMYNRSEVLNVDKADDFKRFNLSLSNICHEISTKIHIQKVKNDSINDCIHFR